VAAHVFGDASGEGGNLFLDVHEEGVRRLATLFADGVTVLAIEFHGHGVSATAVQFWGSGGGLDGGVDVRGAGVRGAALVAAGGEGSVNVCGECWDVGDLPSKGSDGIVGFMDGVIVNDVPFCSIFLVGEGEGGGIGGEQSRGAGVERDLTSRPRNC
jgi:hypothetical protein